MTARGDDRSALAASLHVEVIADLICPFCFLGKRRLDAALEAVRGPRDVSWYPYQLNPDMPAAGMSFDDYLSRRFGNPANIQPVLDGLVAEGQGEGIRFRFDKIGHVPNTLPAHQLMQLAETRGKDQTRLAESLLRAFFERGENIGAADILVEIAGWHGLDADSVRRAIGDGTTRQIVLAREAQVRASGLSGVPGFLLNRRLLVVGAQPTDVLIGAFDQAMFGDGDDDLPRAALH
jgi:predicted DsbA family dithiol-disulfide isomerase